MTALATDAICYRDAYLGTTDARVVAVDDAINPLVVLDRTVFYPGGGGQPADRGSILRTSDGRAWTVDAATKDGDTIVHTLAASPDGPPVGPGQSYQQLGTTKEMRNIARPIRRPCEEFVSRGSRPLQ